MRQVPGWAGEPAAGAKFDRNAIELPRYASIESDARQAFQGMVGEYLAGKRTPEQLRQGMREALTHYETQAFVAGRRARGVTSTELTPAEETMLRGRHIRNMGYFDNFIEGMKAGRGRMNYVKRAGLYADSLWSVYTRSESVDWDEAEQANARYYWIMDPDAEHCTTGRDSDLRGCIERAKKSRNDDGFSWDELSNIGWPGEGTLCRTCITTPHSRVLTGRGWVPIADVKIGDLVLTHRLRWRRVSATPQNPARAEHRQAWVTLNGERIGFTSDHQIWTPEGWLPLGTVQRRRLPMYTVNLNALPEMRERSSAILLEGVPRPGTTLYDLTVEDDHSFVVEGLVVHNSCRCHVRAVHKKVVLPERFDDAGEAPNADSGFKTLEELLGGSNLPLKIPAAGVPYTAVSPETVHESVGRSEDPVALAKRLPLLPLVLTKPFSVVGEGNYRLYSGYGLEVLIGRGEDGLWQILSLLLPGEQRRAA